MTPKGPGFRKRSDALILALIAAKNEAFELELFGTAHAIDGATTKIGWEVADFVTGKRTLRSYPPKPPYVKCEGSNQPPLTENGECQVCGRVFTLSISGYVPRHKPLRKI